MTELSKSRIIEIRNIYKKLQDGKTLTSREGKLIEEYEASQGKTQSSKRLTWQQLADKLGVTEATIHKKRKLEGSPTEPDVDQWLEYLRATQSIRGRPMGITGSKQIEELRARLVEEQGRKEAALASLRELELKMKIESLVPETDLVDRIMETLIPLRRLLDALPKAIAHTANPGEPNVAEVAIRKGLDQRVFSEIERIMENLKTNYEERYNYNIAACDKGQAGTGAQNKKRVAKKRTKPAKR
jgi:transcriptional regulator with XRE-family HTH domain